MKFRRKPIVVEAEQFFVNKLPWPEGVQCGHEYGAPFIRTLEGDMYVPSGNWVITGIKGEKYSCKPDIFEQLYEPVMDEAEDLHTIIDRILGVLGYKYYSGFQVRCSSQEDQNRLDRAMGELYYAINPKEEKK